MTKNCLLIKRNQQSRAVHDAAEAAQRRDDERADAVPGQRHRGVLAVQLGAWMLSSGEGDRLAARMHGDEAAVAFTTLVRRHHRFLYTREAFCAGCLSTCVTRWPCRSGRTSRSAGRRSRTSRPSWTASAPSASPIIRLRIRLL